jgi:hypothetical protein
VSIFFYHILNQKAPENKKTVAGLVTESVASKPELLIVKSALTVL